MPFKPFVCCLLIIIELFVVFCRPNLMAQNTTSKTTTVSHINNKRLTTVSITGAVLFTGTMTGLYNLWYKDFPQTGFHFINDNNEWLQLDKSGHMMTSYYLGKIGYASLRWCGLDPVKAAWWGGSAGFIYLLTIETLDGFSAEWGASTGDLIANSLGSALFISQQLLWQEQRIIMKFSYHATGYPKFNPELLGKNRFQNVIKDYNGHTYWLTFNINSFVKNNTLLPKWLNLAIGYSGEGMTGAAGNLYIDNGENFTRYRKFFLSFDADLTRIETKSGFLKTLFHIIGFIKVPFPSLEYNTKNGMKFHLLYF